MWREVGRTAIALIQENNDFYRLLERPPVTNEAVYFFNSDGLIDGLLIRPAGERNLGLTEEFSAWAAKHDPEELNLLMPQGDIDPSGDHPERFRRLLDRWRECTGRPMIK